jgi:hypothetical protein
MFEKITTDDGLLAVCNFVRAYTGQPMSLTRTNILGQRYPVDGYEVHLPRYANRINALFLLTNSHPHVRLRYTMEDLR